MTRSPFTLCTLALASVASVPSWGCGDEVIENPIRATDAASSVESGLLPDSGPLGDSASMGDSGSVGPSCAPWSGYKGGKSTPGPTWAGGAPNALTAYSGQDNAALTFAIDSTHLYWQNGNGALLTCPLSGCSQSAPVKLYTIDGDNVSTLVASGGSAYSPIFPMSGSGINIEIGTCPAEGCGENANVFFAPSTGGIDIPGIAGDSVNLYFQDAKGLESCAYGSACHSPTTLAGNDDNASYWPLASNGHEVFFVEQSTGGGPNFGLINAVPIGGGGASRNVCSLDLSSPVVSLVAADGYVYFADDVTIYQCPVGGGEPTVYASDFAPDRLATDGVDLFWTNLQPAETATVARCKLGAACCQAETVAANQSPRGQSMLLAVTDSYVYWTSSTGIYQAAK
jgi:hypothetical protein